MLVYSLCSSSRSGNCYLLLGRHGVILVDCGSTNRHLRVCLEDLGLDIASLGACLVSHSHPDHTRSLRFLQRHGVPVLAREATCEALNAGKAVHQQLTTLCMGGSTALPGGFSVRSWEVPHYAQDSSCGFVVTCADETCTIITDAGSVPDDLINAARGSTYIICESNHDETRARSQIPFDGGRSRPFWVLQHRSLGPLGHLSNDQAGYALSKMVSSETRAVLLCHLSEDFNTPQVALRTAREALGGWGGALEVAQPGWTRRPIASEWLSERIASASRFE